MSFLIIMVLLLVVMYVLMIRPQRKRQQEQQAMIEGAGVGDDILTTGGIYGTVIRTEGDDIVVEIADELRVHMTRRGIAAVLPPEAEDVDEVIDSEALEEGAQETGEAFVTDGEDGVTSGERADAPSGHRS